MNFVITLVLVIVLGASASEACQCTDIRPLSAPEFSCAQQASYGKCDKDYLQGYCNISCNRCGDKCKCNDKQPMNTNFTCQEFASFGGCGRVWMRDGFYCAATCGYCDNSTGKVFSEGISEISPEVPLNFGIVAEADKVTTVEEEVTDDTKGTPTSPTTEKVEYVPLEKVTEETPTPPTGEQKAEKPEKNEIIKKEAVAKAPKMEVEAVAEATTKAPTKPKSKKSKKAKKNKKDSELASTKPKSIKSEKAKNTQQEKKVAASPQVEA
eukprot:TRINITY_DN15646_c0_g1_i1.p1 TRINITY_DN15646_c0_g1~~TRINITY_DN15646_c0_g1_i1.p1  ORF type:complete len:267 (+),score=72.76 TRINITY_DN15646_c0_g1_i1:99-899(+)